MELNLGRPIASACVRGSDDGYNISGTVGFYPFRGAVLVVADIRGLPRSDSPCSDRVFALHIHEGGSCAGAGFPLTGGHYNPNGCRHPHHAGDLPPLFANGARAFMAVMTSRFTINEIIGKTVIIHDMRDDFTTQPSGDSGKKIACGVIKRA